MDKTETIKRVKLKIEKLKNLGCSVYFKTSTNGIDGTFGPTLFIYPTWSWEKLEHEVDKKITDLEKTPTVNYQALKDVVTGTH